MIEKITAQLQDDVEMWASTVENWSLKDLRRLYAHANKPAARIFGFAGGEDPTTAPAARARDRTPTPAETDDEDDTHLSLRNRLQRISNSLRRTVSKKKSDSPRTPAQSTRPRAKIFLSPPDEVTTEESGSEDDTGDEMFTDATEEFDEEDETTDSSYNPQDRTIADRSTGSSSSSSRTRTLEQSAFKTLRGLIPGYQSKKKKKKKKEQRSPTTDELTGAQQQQRAGQGGAPAGEQQQQQAGQGGASGGARPKTRQGRSTAATEGKRVSPLEEGVEPATRKPRTQEE